MPVIPLPPGAPAELAWYFVAWLGVTGVLVTLLRLVKGDADLAQTSDSRTISKLPELNQYLFTFFLNPRAGASPYSPVSDLTSLQALVRKISDTRHCQLLSDRLLLETGNGTTWAVIHALLAFLMAGAYWLSFPNRELVVQFSVVLFCVSGSFTLWHLIQGISVRVRLHGALRE